MKDFPNAALSDEEIIARYNLKETDRVLDVGGSSKQHKIIKIDTLADLNRPENDAYWPAKLSAKHFVKVDVCRQILPFEDKEFDFCLCTHTLEDLYNPFLIIEEMSRVAKRGYIATPSRGQDMVFSHLDLTDWRTGARRVPGHAHHRWFFENVKETMVITPKNYPLLYTSEFQMVGWQGDAEYQFYWEDKINYRLADSVDFHNLIANYREFVANNEALIKTGTTLFYLDNPYYIIKEFTKLLLKRGMGFKK